MANTPGAWRLESPGAWGLESPGAWGLESPGVWGLESPGVWGLESPGAVYETFALTVSVHGSSPHHESSQAPIPPFCLKESPFSVENPRDGRAWWAAVYGVTQSRTRLKRLSSNSSRAIVA